jgi:hypothetical protein
MSQVMKGVGVIALSFIPYVGPFLALAASARLSFENQRIAQRKALAQYNANLRDQMVTVKGGVNPRPIVYGRTAVGGQLIYAESFGPKKEQLVLVIALAHGEVDAIETVYFNDVPLTIDAGNLVTNAPYAFTQDNFYQTSVTVPGAPYQVTLAGTPLAGVTIQDVTDGMGGGDNGSPPILLNGPEYTLSGSTITFAAAKAGRTVQISYSTAGASQSYASVWRFTGAPGQDLSTTMLAIGAPSWTAADKCQGMAALIVRLVYAENLWPAGIPNIKAAIRGRKVYDPRSAVTAWTDNAALCARDYLTFQYGLGAASGRIDDAGATNPSANICDEDVQLTATPTYQDRYTINGAISTAADRLSNLTDMANAMAGSINYSQGKWRIRAGAYTAPALTLGPDQLTSEGGIQIVPYSSRRDLINGATGSFINASAGYIEDQFQLWSSPTFVTEDGGVAQNASLNLTLVTDAVRAQRLAKIAVYRSREQLRIAVRCKLSTYAWQVGDMVSVTLPDFGFSAKPFRIVERAFAATDGMRFVLLEEPNGIYDWNLGEASVLTGAANTTLPNPAVVGVPTITGITSAQWLYKAGDGTFVARIRVAVTPPADEYVQKGGKLQLQYKRGDWTQDWSLVEAAGSATQIWIDPAFDAQNYVIRVRAVNNAGFASAWSAMQTHTCQGRPGQIVNLLFNSDFAQDLGYGSTFYPDARSLRNWGFAKDGANYLCCRNYDSGKTWNIGKGGACIYDPSNALNRYAYLQQAVPVQAGVEYEASVSVSIHRANVILYLRYTDAAGNVTGDFAESYNSGSATVGSPYNTADHKRLWVKGTAPAGTVNANVLLLCQATSQSSPYPFTAWSKSMLCNAPSGVTRETATPWVDSDIDSLTGQRIDEYAGAYTSSLDYSGFNGAEYSQVPHYFYFTPRTTGMADVEIVIDVAPWGGSGVYGNGLEAACVVGPASGYPTGRNIGDRAVAYSNVNNTAMSITLTASLPVTAGVGYWTHPTFWAYASGGVSWTVRRVAYTVRCIRRT